VWGPGFAIQNKLEDMRVEVLERLPRCQMKGKTVENLPVCTPGSLYFWLQTKSLAISPKLPSDTCPN
jgi:hypothetical protein